MLYYYNIVAAFWGMHVSPANIAMRDYQESVTSDYRTDTRTDRQTDEGQSDPYVPLCFAQKVYGLSMSTAKKRTGAHNFGTFTKTGNKNSYFSAFYKHDNVIITCMYIIPV